VAPQTIVDASPEPGATLEPEMFRWRPEQDAERPVRPSRRRALEALPDAGSVLDVGVGGGASSLGLAPTVSSITGVDRLPGMLELFESSARVAGVVPSAVLGSWPDVADQVQPVDVAVCHHALYGVAEIEPFVRALTDRARHRVVLELSADPPLRRLNPLWKAFHGIERPDWPVADEAQAVLDAMGLAVAREDTVEPARTQDVTAELVAFARRRLHVGADRDAEIEGFLRTTPPPTQTIVALWWPGAA
jgi:SAM-dependent methyltransferase